jgi:monoamine oxidase
MTLLSSACQLSPTRTDSRVVIVGGGLAGLTTAYELQKRGIQSVILEERDTLGGRVATAHYPNGLQAEYGLQELWAKNPTIDLARELGVPLDQVAGKPYSSVIIDGKLYPFVQDTAEDFFASFLSKPEITVFHAWLQQAAVLRETALTAGSLAPRLRALQEVSFGAWIQDHQKLPRRVAEFIRLTIECELATPWDNFSALAGLLEFEPFLNSGQTNYHVRGGNQRLIAALTETLRGPRILSAQVVRIVRDRGVNNQVLTHVYYQQGGHLQSVEADAVVLAIPFTRVHAISLTPPLSLTKQRAVASLGYGQYVVVHIIVDRNVEKLWQIADRSPLPILTSGALGVIYGTREEGNATTDEDVFTLLIHGTAARKLHMRSHDEIVEELVVELSKLWPGFERYRHESYVYSHHPAAVAVWPPGRSPIDAQARSLFEPELGLYFAGDWLIGAHSDGAVISAQQAARRIAADLRVTQ